MTAAQQRHSTASEAGRKGIPTSIQQRVLFSLLFSMLFSLPMLSLALLVNPCPKLPLPKATATVATATVAMG